MGKLVNRARMTVSGTPGTGVITLSAAVTGFQTFAAAGVVNTDVVSYCIEDGTSWEIGQGTYSSTGPTLTRTTVQASSNAGAAISATSSAQVFVTLLAADIPTMPTVPTAAAASDVRTGTDTTKFVTASALAGSAAFQTLTDGATISWAMGSGYNAKVTLGGNRTLATPTGMIEGMTYTLQVIQDGTGSRTLTWPASTVIDWGGAGTPVLSTTAAKIDVVTLICLNASTPLFRAAFNKGT